MENELKKHINSLSKRKLKEVLKGVVDENEKANKHKQVLSEFEYSKWLKSVLSIEITAVLPRTDSERMLFELLLLELSYKQSVKKLSDENHPILNEVLIDLGLENDLIEDVKSLIAFFDIDKLDYYLLFQESLTENYSMEMVREKITTLALDSRQGSIISHASKMTHPATKYPKINSTPMYSVDGFLKSGALSVDFDMHINAVKLKVYKFLSLRYKGIFLLDYVKKNDSFTLSKIFGAKEPEAKKWIQDFKFCVDNEDTRTDRLIKQVYFPVENSYHLLSPLQPSGLIFKLKEKIDYINDRSSHAYLGKKHKKNGTCYSHGFSTLTNLTVTKHGGEHPKNISGLNNKHQTYYLLPSIPPELIKRNVHFPKTNFFVESIRRYDYQEMIYGLHKLFKVDPAQSSISRSNLRKGIDNCIQELIDMVIEKMWAVRAVSNEQFNNETSLLSGHQRTWLYDGLTHEREQSDEWLDKLLNEMSRWIVRTYEERIGKKKAIILGEAERLYIAEMIENNKEGLR